MPPVSPRIAFYLTGHGFGHAARMKPVIDRLATMGVTLYIRSGTNPKFFAYQPELHFHREHYDVGAVQRDGLNVDVLATLEQAAAIHADRDEIIAREVAFLREQGVHLIVSDITPLAFDIASKLGIPSIGISHFTWTWIYEPYVEQYPEYAYLVDSMRESYGKATLALQMPFAHNFDEFPFVEPIPLIVRERVQPDDAVRAEFGVPDGARIAALSMGGMDWGASPLDALRQKTDWVFILPPDMAVLAGGTGRNGSGNFRAVPDDYLHFQDISGAADLVIAKAGAGTLYECITYHTPLIYTFRNDFREEELLRPAIEMFVHSHYVDKAAFESGAWIEAIDSLVNRDTPLPAIATNGAEIATNRIMAVLHNVLRDT